MKQEKEWKLKEVLEDVARYKTSSFNTEVKFSIWCKIFGHSFKKPFYNFIRAWNPEMFKGLPVVYDLEMNNCQRCNKPK